MAKTSHHRGQMSLNLQGPTGRPPPVEASTELLTALADLLLAAARPDRSEEADDEQQDHV